MVAHCARTQSDFDIARTLFEEYEREVKNDLCFQGFEAELRNLEEHYSGPQNGIIIALEEGNTCGCAAYQDLGDGVVEVRRMYLRAEYRGKGVGKKLLEAVLQELRIAGYTLVRLHTLPSMEAAYTMYRSAGFTDIEPYLDIPRESVRFMELKLPV